MISGKFISVLDTKFLKANKEWSPLDVNMPIALSHNPVRVALFSFRKSLLMITVGSTCVSPIITTEKKTGTS